MKKWLPVAIVFLLTGGIVLLIFTKRIFSTTIESPCTIAAADRCFENIAGWGRWWPKNGSSYKIGAVHYNDVRLSIRLADGRRLDGDLRLAPVTQDSTLINWTGTVPLLWREKEVRRSVDTVLLAFRAFVEDSRNVYNGVKFYRAMSKDSTLVALTSTGPAYPTTGEVYARIDSLRSYISGEGAAAIDSPWLNVTRLGPVQFRMMVAIPVNKRLAGKGRISNKNFVPWRMLEGDVYGGVRTVEQAFEEMQKYKIDHNMTIMALPFQSLITDRRKEQDTTKWLTVICAPVS